METNSGRAHADLAAVEAAQDAVCNKPWPVWLYIFNTVALALYPVVLLAGLERPQGLWVLSGAVIAVNLLAGIRMGTPLAMPRVRGFLIPFWCSVGFVVVGSVAALSGITWLALLGSVGAGGSYALASFNHWQVTRVRR